MIQSFNNSSIIIIDNGFMHYHIGKVQEVLKTNNKSQSKFYVLSEKGSVF